jgi:ankyrin repeat protein
MATDEVKQVWNLCRAIRRRNNWEEVESLLNSFPGRVPNMYLLKRQSCLHVTAEADPPAYILRQILRMVDIDFCSQPDEFGATPLSLICEYGRDMDSIHLLALERPQDFFVPTPRYGGNSPCEGLMCRIHHIHPFPEADIAQIIVDVAEVWPDGVLHEQKDGQTLLQRAMQFSPSMDFILLRTILTIQPELFEMIDYKGASAIHVALRPGDGDGPAVKRLEFLLDWGGSHALCVQDSNGQTPLHEACQRNLRGVIMIIIASQPSALNVRDKHGMTPMDTFRHWNRHSLRLGYTGLDWDENHNKLADTAMTLLTGAPVYCSDSPSLHELLHNQECTLDIAKLLIYALRDQASVKDGNGNVPLHIVASRYSDDDLMYGKVIATLLEVYPAACRISNSEGTLPLQLMHRAGKSWSNGMKMVLLQHPAAVLDLELNRVARCALLAKVGSEERPDALFQLFQDAPVFFPRANVAPQVREMEGMINENVHRREGKDVEEKQSADRRKSEAPLRSMPAIEEAELVYTKSGTKAETSATVYATADRSETLNDSDKTRESFQRQGGRWRWLRSPRSWFSRRRDVLDAGHRK